MKTYARTCFGLLVAAGLLLAFSPPAAEAVSFRFDSIKTRHSENANTGEAQIWGDVADAGEGQAWFRFHNDGPHASSVTQIYFDGDILSRLVEVDDSQAGGRYATNGASAREFPGAARLGFSADFSVRSQPPAKHEGVNPGEEVAVLFFLKEGVSFAHLLDAMAIEDLRIGLHVQAFSDGGSEAFLSAPIAGAAPVPEPATVLFLGSGLIGLAAVARRRKNLQEKANPY